MDGDLKSAHGPRFIADTMVGKLARWLRILGLDVVYDTTLDDRQLLARARRDRRVLLTRDVPLATRTNGAGAPPGLLIESDDFRVQLQQVVTAFELDPWRALFTRCVDCNEPLRTVSRQEARERVPPYVFSTQGTFKRCARCDKFLWGGTHRSHMKRVLDTLFAPDEPRLPRHPSRK